MDGNLFQGHLVNFKRIFFSLELAKPNSSPLGTN